MEYVKTGNLYFSAEIEDALLPQVLELVGEGQIMFGSDMPHGDRERFAERLLRERKDISEAAKDKNPGVESGANSMESRADSNRPVQNFHSADFEEQHLWSCTKVAFDGFDFVGHPAFDGIIVGYDSAPRTQLAVENRPELGVKFRQHVKSHHSRRRYVDGKCILSAKFDEMFDLFAKRQSAALWRPSS